MSVHLRPRGYGGLHTTVALGVDPGLAHSGFAVVVEASDGTMKVAHTEVAATERGDIAAGLRVSDDDNRRLTEIHHVVVRLLCELNPTVVGIETYVPLVNKGGNGAFKVAIVYGLVQGLAISANRPVYGFTPQDIRRSLLGTQTGTKQDVQVGLRRVITGVDEALERHPRGQREHVADAMGHAYLALEHSRMNRRVKTRYKERT